MKPFPSLPASLFLAATLVAGCGPSAAAPGPSPETAPAPYATRGTGATAPNPADVAFMAGMIHHHAQAILIAGWAPSHEASPAIRVLCERIIVAQRDEIGWMQRWLAQHGQEAPEADTTHAMMPGMHHPMMPGMLNAEQLADLNAARGADFDRLFLTYMIQHHQGAITMVSQLLAVPGGGEDNTVFKLVSDMNADQTTEIDRMRLMLDSQSQRAGGT